MRFGRGKRVTRCLCVSPPAWVVLSVHFWLLVTSLCGVTGEDLCGQQADPSDGIFDIDKIAMVEFDFSEKEWNKLQPPPQIDWDLEKVFAKIGQDVAAGNNTFRNGDDVRPGLAGYFGVNHEYGSAAVTIDGVRMENVGVRYKGNGTFWAGHEFGKYSFKIDFSEFVKGQEFAGLKKLNLNNGITDPSMLREPMSYQFFRAAGVPASRTGWAMVSFSKEGADAQTELGLYLTVEQVDKRFLKRHFGSAKGLLLKPSCFGSFLYLGEDWTPYEMAYVPKTDPTEPQKRTLIEFAKLVHQGSDLDFQSQIANYLDMESFYSFLSANVILSNLDSFLAGVQNYYVYLDPETNRFHFIPWDLDSSMGAFSLVGSPATRRDLSIDAPQVGDGNNLLIERILKVPAYREAYRERLRELVVGPFGERAMSDQLDLAVASIRPYFEHVEPSELNAFDQAIAGKPTGIDSDPLAYFIKARRQSLEEQLNGKSTGKHVDYNDPAIPEAYIFALLELGMLFVLMGLIHLGIWVWGVVAGFRLGSTWGLLNLLLYPMAPIVFGFLVSPENGRRVATICLFAILMTLTMTGLSLAFFDQLVAMNQ